MAANKWMIDPADAVMLLIDHQSGLFQLVKDIDVPVLRANVVAALKLHLNKEQVDSLLDEMGFAPDTRAEHRLVKLFRGLVRAITKGATTFIACAAEQALLVEPIECGHDGGISRVHHPLRDKLTHGGVTARP